VRRLRWLALAVLILPVAVGCRVFDDTVTYYGSGGAIGAGVTTTFSLSVPDAGDIVSVKNVTLSNAVMSAPVTVRIELRAPGGQRVTLVSTESNDFNGTYGFTDNDDSYGLVRRVAYGGVLVPETYQADGDLDDLEETSVFGTWSLLITDFGVTGGTLGSWSLRIKFE
jgi:hypothetical protein